MTGAIMSVLPQHKTDAIFRVFNTDRYDDRDVVITNLIESYDRLIAFGQKHLNNTFHLDGIQSVSARDNILREIVSNLLAHRDFSNAYVAKLVIEKEQIFTENANLSHGHGALNLATFEPFPKNPPISKVFREIGLADELGSGMRNTYKYTKMYSGSDPLFVEGDIFRITIPLTEVATATVGPEGTVPHDVSHGVPHDVPHKTVENMIIDMIKENPNITREQMGEKLNLSSKTIGRKIKELGNIRYVGSGNNGHWEIDSSEE